MNSKTLAIALFVTLGLMFINIPLISGESNVAALIVLIVGIILLLKK